MTAFVLIRHAEPLLTGNKPPAQWPLTEKGRNDAMALGRMLAGQAALRGAGPFLIWTSPERRASETAALAFPAGVTVVRDQLSEVKKPWYDSSIEHNNDVAEYLRGGVVKGWEPREEVLARIVRLNTMFPSSERLVLVSHGLFLTTWLNHEIGLEDPYAFWSNLGTPDAWELHPSVKTLTRVL